MSQIMKNIPLFSGLGDEELAVLFRYAVRKPVARNTLLFAQGSPGDALYIIQRGKVKVVLSDVEGKEVILTVLGSGDFFGEMALIDDEPRSAGVMTMESSEFYVISKSDFRTCIASQPELATNLMRHLSRRLRAADQKIGSLALMDVYGRVAGTLLQLAENDGDKRVLTGRYTQKDIASMVGASREMVSRIFKDLTEAGFIEPDGDRMILHERPRSST